MAKEEIPDDSMCAMLPLLMQRGEVDTDVICLTQLLVRVRKAPENRTIIRAALNALIMPFT
jgi:hypothetical protein